MKFLAETSCPVCIGCHIQTALLAEVTDFSFLLPATTIRKKKKKKACLSISLMIFFERNTVNLALLLLMELPQVFPTIYVH